MEWVYKSDGEDEPVLYEGDGELKLRPRTSSQDKDSDVISLDANSEEYLGDEVDDLRIPPSEAFAQLSNLVLGRQAKGILEGNEDIAKHGSIPHSRKVSVAESREERLRRLRKEIEDLEQEDGIEQAGEQDNVFVEFRNQLNAIEQYTSTLSGNSKSRTLVGIETGTKRADNATNGDGGASFATKETDPVALESMRKADDDGFTVNVYAANLTSVLSLEERVASLERIVGSSIQVEAQGTNVCKLMNDVQSKLELMSEESCGERLKREAEQVSSVLKQTNDTSSLAEPLRLGTVLNKMEEWETVAATVPAVISRLRSLKRLHDEAGGFVSTVRDLNTKYETIVSTRQENKDLVAMLSENLVTNLAAINENMTLLESRLEALSTETSGKQS